MAHLRGCRSGIHFGKDTTTYRLFEKLFLDLGEDKLPFKIPSLTKGQAVNMAMGLNRCQIQWGKEAGIPRDMLTRSAKAKFAEDGTWYLEVSASGNQLYKETSWMRGILDGIEPVAATPPEPTPPKTQEPDPIADAIRSQYGDIL
jgi:hypothetical protein